MAWQCWNNVATICNNVAMLCCAKNCPCELFRVTSPLVNKLTMESSPKTKELQPMWGLIKLEVLNSCEAALHSVDMSL